ncbi:MAG: hypothetical protein K2P38_09735 [Lachnospiraceae bacterium]|nr:hypothetical protein [Lachnospiraceae bacterium]
MDKAERFGIELAKTGGGILTNEELAEALSSLPKYGTASHTQCLAYAV